MTFRNDMEREFWMRVFLQTVSQNVQAAAAQDADMAVEALRERETTLRDVLDPEIFCVCLPAMRKPFWSPARETTICENCQRQTAPADIVSNWSRSNGPMVGSPAQRNTIG